MAVTQRGDVVVFTGRKCSDNLIRTDSADFWDWVDAGTFTKVK